jgi:hypothetical protein
MIVRADGNIKGLKVGTRDGSKDEDSVGLIVGDLLGLTVGEKVGFTKRVITGAFDS